MSLILIHPAPDSGWAGQRLDDVLKYALAGREVRAVRTAAELSGLENQRLILALPLGDTGVNLEYTRKNASFPTKGSVIILNASAENGSSSDE